MVVVFHLHSYFKKYMLDNRALSLANPTGWISENCFLKALLHFVHFGKPTAESWALTVQDNHKTHITMPIVFQRKYLNDADFSDLSTLDVEELSG